MRPEGGSGVEMQIYMPDGSRVELAAKDRLIEEILKELKINSEEVIVTLNGRIVAEE
jgi:sulfur carrier protein ThiS